MSKGFHEEYKKYLKSVELFWNESDVESGREVEYILNLINESILNNDTQRVEFLIDTIFHMKDLNAKIEAYNKVLIIKDHRKHQEVTREIQLLGHPSSTYYIGRVLEGGFEHLAYTFSESAVIAKWFSHALCDIGTPEAIALIAKHSKNPDEGIKNEMSYRLSKIEA